MSRNLVLVGTLAAALATTAGCSNMTASQQSTLSGAGIGTAAGVAVGAITGEWAWAAAGAAIGAGAGYLTEQERQRQAAAQQKAFDAGVQAGKQQAKQ
jgi:osmotically inducible lipoprotein OsmB